MVIIGHDVDREGPKDSEKTVLVFDQEEHVDVTVLI